MPRIFTSQNDPLDFCAKCFPSEQTAWDRYRTLGDGPDGRGNCFGYNEDHPAYEDDDNYYCELCNKRLTAKDNKSV